MPNPTNKKELETFLGMVTYLSKFIPKLSDETAPIEKEMCVILFACRKFHDFIFGKQVTIITDHKPLIGIPTKSLDKLSPRLQCMRLHLLRYDIRLQWQPGKDMFVPDALSRLPISDMIDCAEFDDSLDWVS